MCNPDLPKLLREMIEYEHTGDNHNFTLNQQIAIEQSAIGLEKLEKIYKWAEGNKHCPAEIHTMLYKES